MPTPLKHETASLGNNLVDFFFTLKIYCTSPEGRQVGQAPGEATVLANLSFFAFPYLRDSSTKIIF